ncbi:EspA/EspE family type VII secretion system effector [Mycolicibacterium sp. lyk4-40-TYG-92]|uniref:TPR repeat region-containing protein n=1 Tax=Mycolicibacterium sp. lyk4-40-TYG-92 TaxID=3040295 RepID=UPI00254D4CF2|nr:EspA/EspE family type VII secretion system effector [Mycolicibacterium sp. lyk4-40-TYG-92]
MGDVLDAFDSVWQRAHATFGTGTPQTGEHFDKSTQLRGMQATVQAAAPGDNWSGTASTAYGKANNSQGRALGGLADLDQQLRATVDRSAEIVTKGRQGLDETRKWVQDMAAQVPAGRNRDMQLLPIASQGLKQVSDLLTSTVTQQNAVAGDIKALTTQYSAIKGDLPLSPKDDKKDDKDNKGDKETVVGDDKKDGKDDKKSPAQTGADDANALQNGQLTPEQRERLTQNTTLSPEQQAALHNGKLNMPPDQMAYLQGFSRAFGDKTPAEIKAIMDKAGPDGKRVADVFQLASNPNIKTGLPETQPPSIDHPSSGGKYALPDGIQKVLDGPALTQDFSSGVFADGRWLVPPDPIGPMHGTTGLNDLANIVQSGNRDLQAGTALDSGLFTKSQEMLDQSNNMTIAQAHAPGADGADRARWYHEHVDPTLQNMFNALNKDDMVIHDAVTGSGRDNFLDNLTKHEWQDNGLAAGGLFDWVGDTAAHDSNGRAAQTAHALAEYMSDPDKHHLLNLESAPGQSLGQSLGQVNPELTRDWARALSPYLDDMVGNNTGGNNGLFPPLDPADGSKTEPTNTRHVMSVLMSDHPPADQKPDAHVPKTASQIVFEATQHHVNEMFDKAALSAVDPNGAKDDFSAQAAGRLQAALNLGSFDEANSRLHNDFQAQHDAWQLRSKLYDIAGAGVDQFGAPGGAAKDVMDLGKEYIIGPEPKEGKAASPVIPGTFPTQQHMAEVLAQSNAGDLSKLSGYFEDGKLKPPDQNGGRDYQDYHNAVVAYLESIGKSGSIDSLLQSYWNTYTGSIYGTG